MFSYFKSKTVSFGAILIALAVAQEVLPQLQTLLPAGFYGAATGVVGAIVIILRALTSTSLVDKVDPTTPPQ